MQLIVAVIAVLLGQVDVRSHLPQQLQEVMDSRKAQTSEIEWTITYLQGRDAGLVERHITRTVGDTVWQVNLGDDKAQHRTAFRHLPREDSQEAWREAAIPKEDDAGPRHSLLYNGDIWHLEHQKRVLPLIGSVMPEGQGKSYRPLDFTAACMGPWWYEGHHAYILGLPHRSVQGFESATYTSVSRGNIEVITGRFDGKSIEWQLDKTRGGHPISAAFYSGDRVLNYSYTDLTKIDGRFFPSSIRFYARDDQQPYKVIDVQEASFDKPEHVQEITPEDIGVLFGTQLLAPNGYNIWDGTRLITYDEYDELIYIYGLRPDPIITEKLAKLMGRTVEEHLQRMDRTMEQWRERYLKEHGEEPWESKKTEKPDEWDLYVAKFIKKHNLDEPRVKRANELLGRAKKLRDYHKRKNRSEVRKAKEEGNTEKIARYEAVTERIFKRVLLRGLHKLIPREQRRAG